MKKTATMCAAGAAGAGLASAAVAWAVRRVGWAKIGEAPAMPGWWLTE